MQQKQPVSSLDKRSESRYEINTDFTFMMYESIIWLSGIFACCIDLTIWFLNKLLLQQTHKFYICWSRIYSDVAQVVGDLTKLQSFIRRNELPVSGYASMNIIISSPVNPDNKHTLGNDFAICICLTQCSWRIISIAITDNPSVIQQMLSQGLKAQRVFF